MVRGIGNTSKSQHAPKQVFTSSQYLFLILDTRLFSLKDLGSNGHITTAAAIDSELLSVLGSTETKR